jgi:hypothetical protein
MIYRRVTTRGECVDRGEGATDMISFLGLGAVFSSIMTGNLV